MKVSQSSGEVLGRVATGVRMVSRRQLVLFLLLWIVSIAVGYWGYGFWGNPSQSLASTIDFPVRRGSLATTVAAAGSVVPTKQSKLSFGVAGSVAEVNVAVGDAVKAGQQLARLDTAQLESKVAEAEANLKVAQLKLRDLQAGSPQTDIAAAQAAYDSAATKLNELTAGPDQATIQSADQALAAAQATLTKAESDLATLRAKPDADAVRMAQLQLEQAKDSLWSTQISRDGTCGMGKDYQCQAGNASVGAAETAVNQAALKLEMEQRPATTNELAKAEKDAESARAAVQAAQTKLDQAKAGPKQSELASARSGVATAQASLADKTRGATEQDIAQAEATLRQAERAYQQAKDDLKGAIILAPFDGVITEDKVNQGETATISTAVLTITDLQATRVDATISESDIAKVKVGQSVQVAFDALPGQKFNGKVDVINPSPSVSQGVVNYPISVLIDAGDKTLPLGTTASASVIIDQKENVLMVPNRAIRSEGSNKLVDLKLGDKTETRAITTGMVGDQNTEVVTGVNEGDVVSIPMPTLAGGSGSANQMVGGGMGMKMAVPAGGVSYSVITK